MDSGSVMDQLQQMNQNLSQALDKLTLYEQEISHFIHAKDQLVSEAFEGLRSRYEQLHLPLIKGFKNCFQA